MYPYLPFSNPPTSGTTTKQFVKDIPELHVEGGVDDGVDSAVDITEPRDHTDQRRPDVT